MIPHAPTLWRSAFRVPPSAALGGHSAFHLPRSASAPSAFTLVEMLLVLALFALVVAILLPATGSLFRGARGETAEDTLVLALQEARRAAVLSGREVRLRFDRDARELVWTHGAKGRAVEDNGTIIEFLRPRDGATVLIGGQLLESEPVSAMIFYPDGTCDPVRVQLRRETGPARVFRIDPWTCAPGWETRS